jgi:hypothetical protein
MGMLHEEQEITDVTPAALFDQRTLNGKCFGVGEQAEPSNAEGASAVNGEYGGSGRTQRSRGTETERRRMVFSARLRFSVSLCSTVSSVISVQPFPP